MKTRKIATVAAPVAPAPKRPINREYVHEFLLDNIRYAQRTTAKFIEDFASNPRYALEWSSKAFEAAGQLEVNAQILRYLVKAGDEVQSLDDLLKVVEFRIEDELLKEFLQQSSEMLMNEAMREVEYPSHSTSVQSNEMARCKASAAYRLAKELNRLILRIEVVNEG